MFLKNLKENVRKKLWRKIKEKKKVKEYIYIY